MFLSLVFKVCKASKKQCPETDKVLIKYVRYVCSIKTKKGKKNL